MITAKKKISAINYFGGKNRYLDFLLPLFPEHHHYIEPFCGSAVVFLNKRPAPIETISDSDERLYNFFCVLRDRPEELIHKLELTTYSRNEFQKALTPHKDPLEQARRYFVRIQMCFAGQAYDERRINSFRTTITESRNGKASDVSKFINKIKGLSETVARFRHAQIENRSFDFIIPKFSRSDFFIYADPPYLLTHRTGKHDYRNDISPEEHLLLADLLNDSKSMVMISHYDCPEYDQYYPAPKWKKIIPPDKVFSLGKGKNVKREAVWINYKPTPQLEMFNEKITE